MLILATFLALAQPETPLPAGYTCEDVRKLVAEKGRPGAILWGVEHGLSFRQIYRIRKVCGV